MVNILNKDIVEKTFNQSYNDGQFKHFITDLLIDANFEKAHNILLPNDYKDFIKSAKRICKYSYTSEEYFDKKVIDVLVVKLKKTSSIDRARTAQRNFIARWLNGARDYQKDAALVAFISEDENGNISPDWRFSFVQMNYKTEIVGSPNGKKKRVTSVELTPAKRFSFLVGQNENTHTAQRQFYNCIEKSSKGEKITIEDLVQAFDIEKVSKEFFDKYKALYLKLRDELTRLCNENKIVNKDFVEHNINVDDFAKKTLGQLVFLYFIQKKGWLGVAKDKDWGTGDKKFLRNVFDKKYCQYNNFFNDILEHLFYEALATDRGQPAWFDKLNCRIPFLNGGLFEPVNGYEWTKTDLTIKNHIFQEIFDTFDLYNFTVKEDEPLEKEVAIDPEMLGKVFENLLPENERKGNGAFYTPREIVHYMCQESLINYIYNKVNIKEVPLTAEEKEQQLKLIKNKKEREQLKLTHDVIEEIVSKNDIEYLIKKGGSSYSNKNVKEELPSGIVQNAKTLDDALADIKVCDPAIGSGAFPVGMMNEIVRARATLSEFIQPDRSVYQLKRQAIENSIYGVDIDPGAVDIAKLRFWLSLVVDEEDVKNIKPLPNLDYKIMQGNSLITSYEGIDFDEIIDEYKPETQLQFNLWGDKTQDIKHDLKLKQQEFLKTPYPTRKTELKQEIEELIVELVKTRFEEKALNEGKDKNFYEGAIRNFAQNKEKRNFFPWKLFFADVFENGGFDIVIGNPPYLESRSSDYTDEMKNDNLMSAEKRWGESSKYFTRGCDLLIFFFELSLYLIKRNGINTFITQNSWLDTEYGKKFQEFLSNNTEIVGIIDSDYKYFDDKEGPNINTVISFLKGKKNVSNMLRFACYHINFEDDTTSLHDLQKVNDDLIVTYKEYNLLDKELKYIKWGTLLYSTDDFLNLLKKLYKKGKRIEGFNDVKIGQGLNISKSFIIDNFDVKKQDIDRNALIPFFTKQASFEINDISTFLVDESKLDKNKICQLKGNGLSLYSAKKTSKNPPKLIMPRGIGRHFCAINNINAFSDSCVDIYDDKKNLSEEQILNLWCFLNSSIAWLLREITGRKNLGGGMLKAEAVDLKAFPLLFNFNKKSNIIGIKDLIKNRDVLDTLNEIDTQEHQMIDKIVFDYLELDDNERQYVINELKNKIINRSNKSKT